MYEAFVKLKNGRRVMIRGTLNECTAFVHELGIRVKKVRIKAVRA